jgi:DNA-binding FadR family transcriptional regulator
MRMRGNRGEPAGRTRPVYDETFQQEHRAIVRAISAGAVAASRAAMRRHLLNSRNCYRKVAALTDAQ